MIICTNLIPKGFSAVSLWPFIFVRPEYRSDIALIEHELVHYREQASMITVLVLPYLVSEKFALQPRFVPTRGKLNWKMLRGSKLTALPSFKCPGTLPWRLAKRRQRFGLLILLCHKLC